MKSITERKQDLTRDELNMSIAERPQEKVTILIKSEDVVGILDQLQEITIQKLRTSNNDMTAASVHGFCSGYKHALQQQIKEKQEMHDLLLGRENNE